MGAKISKRGSYTFEKRAKKKKKSAQLEERASSFISLSQAQIYEDEINTPLPRLSEKHKSLDNLSENHSRNENSEIVTIQKISTVFNTVGSERDDYSSPDDEKIYENIEKDSSTAGSNSEEQIERKNSKSNVVAEKKKRKRWSQSDNQDEDHYFDVREKLSSVSTSEKNEEIAEHPPDENWKEILNGVFWTGGIQASQVQTRKTEEQTEVEVNWYEQEDTNKSEEQMLIKQNGVKNSEVGGVQEEQQVEQNSENLQLDHQIKGKQSSEDSDWNSRQDHKNQNPFVILDHAEANNLYEIINISQDKESKQPGEFEQTVTIHTIQNLINYHENIKGSTNSEQLEVEDKPNLASENKKEQLHENHAENSNKHDKEEQLELSTVTLDKNVQKEKTAEEYTNKTFAFQNEEEQIESSETSFSDSLQKDYQEENANNTYNSKPKDLNDSEEQMEVSTSSTRHKTLTKSFSANSDIYYELTDDGLLVETDSEEQEPFYDAMDFEDFLNEAQVEVIDEDCESRVVKVKIELSELENEGDYTANEKGKNSKTNNKETKTKESHTAAEQAKEEDPQDNFVEVKEDAVDVPTQNIEDNSNSSSISAEGLLIAFDEDSTNLNWLESEQKDNLQINQVAQGSLHAKKTSAEEITVISNFPDKEKNLGVLIDLDSDQQGFLNTIIVNQTSSVIEEEQNNQTKIIEVEPLDVLKKPEDVSDQLTKLFDLNDNRHENLKRHSDQNAEWKVQMIENFDQVKTAEVEISKNFEDCSNKKMMLIDSNKNKSNNPKFSFTETLEANQENFVTETNDQSTKGSQTATRKAEEDMKTTSNEPLLIDLTVDETSNEFFATITPTSQQKRLSMESVDESPLENVLTKNISIPENSLGVSATLLDINENTSNFSISSQTTKFEQMDSVRDKPVFEDLHTSSLKDATQTASNKSHNLPLEKKKQNTTIPENEEVKKISSSTTPEERAQDQMKVWEEEQTAEVKEAVAKINAIIFSINDVKNKIDGLGSSETAKEIQAELYHTLIKIMRDVNNINNSNFNERVIELQHRALNEVHECLRELQMKTLD